MKPEKFDMRIRSLAEAISIEYDGELAARIDEAGRLVIELVGTEKPEVHV